MSLLLIGYSTLQYSPICLTGHRALGCTITGSLRLTIARRKFEPKTENKNYKDEHLRLVPAHAFKLCRRRARKTRIEKKKKEKKQNKKDRKNTKNIERERKVKKKKKTKEKVEKNKNRKDEKGKNRAVRGSERGGTADPARLKQAALCPPTLSQRRKEKKTRKE